MDNLTIIAQTFDSTDVILSLVIQELESQIPHVIISDVYNVLCEMIAIAVKVDEQKEKKK